MEDHATLTQAVDVDYERLLALDLEKARAVRDELVRVASRDPERLETVRTALDTLAVSMWKTITADHRAATDRTNLVGAFALRGMDSARDSVFITMALLGAWQLFGFNPMLLAGTVAGYAAAVAVNVVVLRKRSQRALAVLREHLGRDGRDLRFFACSRLERQTEYPFVGFEGPLDDGSLRERKWMISGLNEREASIEPFIELLDQRAKPVVLSRFPDKTPMIVQADTTNPFIAAHASYVQHALEVHLPSLRRAGEEFREIVARTARVKAAEDRVLALEAELEDAFASKNAWKAVVLPAEVEDDLSARAALFRLDESHAAPMSLLITGAPGTGKTLVAETLARASGASLVPFELPPTTGAVDMRAQYVREPFERARAERSILFVDRCETFFTASDDAADSDVVDAFLRECDDPENAKVWVVAATARPDLLDARIAVKFESELVVLLPDAHARGRILIEAARRNDRAFAPSDALLIATDGMSGRDLDELVTAASADAGEDTLDSERVSGFLARRRQLSAALADADLERGLLVRTGSVAAARDLVAELAHTRGLAVADVISPDQVVPFEPVVFFLPTPAAFGPHLEWLHSGQVLAVVAEDPAMLDEGLRTRLGLTVDVPPVNPPADPLPLAQSA